MVDHVAHHTALATNVGDTDDAWTNVNLLTGYENYGGSYNTAGYRRIFGGLVLLKGLIRTNATIASTNQPFFNLPAGYRPINNCILIGGCNYNTGSAYTHAQRIDVKTDGDVCPQYVNSTASGNWYCLDVIVFLAEQ
jgi:hypothetical protein